jgi:two-component system, chemotaxis family, protein-glutamate methylesterase/glutaminase
MRYTYCHISNFDAMENVTVLLLDPNQTLVNTLSDLIHRDEDLVLGRAMTTDQIENIDQLLNEQNPGVIVLGIDSPVSKEMDLFEYLRKKYSHLPVLVMTPHSRTGAEIALTSLKKGAVEYIVKTTILSGSLLSDEHFNGRLVPVLKAVPRLNRNILVAGTFVDEAVKAVHPVSNDFFKDAENRIKLLVIAGCLGGVPSLYLLLSSLPESLPVPVIVVQHMPDIYTQVLAEDLNKITGLNVVEATNNVELKPGTVYITPGKYHASTRSIGQKNVITLHHGPKVKGFRPSIDVLLQSTQNTYQSNVLAVYLSGGGNDGIDGAKVIDITGGQIIVQNKNSSLLSDLPWKIESLGLHEGSYPLERLGHEISKKIKEGSYNKVY